MNPAHIVVSALVAVVGLLAVFVAQPWLDQRSQSNPAPDVAVPQVPMQTIVVAVRPLRFGTELKQEHLKEVEWAETAIPSGSFESIDDLLAIEGRRAVLSLLPAWRGCAGGPGSRRPL